MLLAILHIFWSEWFRTTWLEYFHICVCVCLCAYCLLYSGVSVVVAHSSIYAFIQHLSPLSQLPSFVWPSSFAMLQTSQCTDNMQSIQHTHIIISLPSATLSVHIIPLLCLHHSGAWLGLTRTHKEWSTVPDLTGVYNQMTSRLSGCLRAIMHSIQSFINQCGSAYGMLIARYMPGSPFSCIKYT